MGEVQYSTPTTHTSLLPLTHHSYHSHITPTTHTSLLPLTHHSYHSHVTPTTHTSLLPLTRHSYHSHINPTTHTSLLPLTRHSYHSHVTPTTHTSLLSLTRHSYHSHITPTTHTSLLPLTRHSYHSHINPTTHTSILPLPHPSPFLSQDSLYPPFRSHLAVPACSRRALCQNRAKSSFTVTLAKNTVHNKVAICCAPPSVLLFSTILPTSSRQWLSRSSRVASMSSWQRVS